MATVKRLVGAALFGYAVLYTLQVVFSSLYATTLPPSEAWRVMNFCTAVGIIVSVTVVCAHKRSAVKPDSPPGQYLARLAAFYTTLALAIWFFTVWFRLLLLSDGESVSFSDDVVWSLVSVLNPLVLGAQGLSSGSRRGGDSHWIR